MEPIYQEYFKHLDKEYWDVQVRADLLLRDFLTYLLKERGIQPDSLQSLLLEREEKEESISAIRKRYVNSSFDIKTKFYQCLMQYGYSPKSDILACCSDLLHPTIDSLKISEWVTTPYIQDICYRQDTGEYTLTTPFGPFTFQNFDVCFKEDMDHVLEESPRLNPFEEMVSEKGINARSHLMAKRFLDLHPDYSIVTAECPHLFKDHTHLISYLVSPDGAQVIDPKSGIVMKKELFEDLVEPEPIHTLSGGELDHEFQLLRKVPSSLPLLQKDPYIGLVVYHHVQKRKGNTYQKQFFRFSDFTL